MPWSRPAPPAFALLTAALLSAPAGAAPPTGEMFEITHFVTGEEDDPVRQFDTRDLENFINVARCECGQPIRSRIRLRTDAGSFDNSTPVRVFAGLNCAESQRVNADSQYRPCVEIGDTLASQLTRNLEVEFHPLWLASGVTEIGAQEVERATPAATCSSGQDQRAGIWICVEDGEASECQQGEFVVTDTQNLNSREMPAAIRADLRPPDIGFLTNLSAEGGDGAVRLSWTAEFANADVAGFRVLCATESGAPVPGKGVGGRGLTGKNVGDIYFTQENLCPDGPFTPNPAGESEEEAPSGSDTGSDAASTTGAGESGTGEAGTTGAPGAGDTGGGDAGLGDTGAGGTGAGDTGAGDTGASDTGAGDTGAGSPGGAGGGGVPREDSGILSLDWDYVCSGHVSGTGTGVRIDGLENEVPYQFVLVAYDAAGNPVIVNRPLMAIPRNTTDLWEQCEQQGDSCGDGGFCAVGRTGGPASIATLITLGVLGLGRRRRGAAA